MDSTLERGETELGWLPLCVFVPDNLGKIFENVENLEQTFKSFFMQVFWNVLDIV